MNLIVIKNNFEILLINKNDMIHAKQKEVFKHAQNAQVQIHATHA